MEVPVPQSVGFWMEMYGLEKVSPDAAEVRCKLLQYIQEMESSHPDFAEEGRRWLREVAKAKIRKRKCEYGLDTAKPVRSATANTAQPAQRGQRRRPHPPPWPPPCSMKAPPAQTDPAQQASKRSASSASKLVKVQQAQQAQQKLSKLVKVQAQQAQPQPAELSHIKVDVGIKPVEFSHIKLDVGATVSKKYQVACPCPARLRSAEPKAVQARGSHQQGEPRPIEFDAADVQPEQKKFGSGDAVYVVNRFFTDDTRPMQIPRGQVGKIGWMNSGGDSYINFGPLSREQEQWVESRKFRHLTHASPSKSRHTQQLEDPTSSPPGSPCEASNLQHRIKETQFKISQAYADRAHYHFGCFQTMNQSMSASSRKPRADQPSSSPLPLPPPSPSSPVSNLKPQPPKWSPPKHLKRRSRTPPWRRRK